MSELSRPSSRAMPASGATAPSPSGTVDEPASEPIPAVPAGSPRRIPERIGPFRIVGVLGVGGMGVVYDAEQETPHRRVALKVIRDSMLDDDESVRRFTREAEVLARLQHPGVAQIYTTGVADGPQGPQPYFAMERVVGEPLGRYAERLDRRARLELFAEVCDAVHYAHQRGVIHRDLKPANVLVDEAGHPKVLDFGVARLTDADVHGAAAATRGLTATGAAVGTLLYMSPEQLSGDPLGVDTRSDVYALGVILYELLAGRHPLESAGGKMAAVAHAVLVVDPPSLGTVDRALRGDLETIAAKALEKDAARRYASAAALAADVRHYVAHEPIAARPSSAAYQLRKLARRHRGVVAASAVAAAALLAGTVASAWSAVRARSAERVAITQRGRAQDALGLAERRRAEATAAQAVAVQQRRTADAERLRADSARSAALRDRGLAVASAARATQEAGKATAVNEFLRQMLRSADPSIALGRTTTVSEILDSAAGRVNAPGAFAGQPMVRASVLSTLAESYAGLGALEQQRMAAESLLVLVARTPAATERDRAEAELAVGEANFFLGRNDAAEGHLRSSLLHARAAGFAGDTVALGGMRRLGALAYLQSRSAAADSIYTVTEAFVRRRFPGESPALANILHLRGQLYAFTDRPTLSAPLLRASLDMRRAQFGTDVHPVVVDVQTTLAFALNAMGDLAGAETMLQQALASARRLYRDRPQTMTANILDRLGGVLASRGRPAEAEPMLREAIAMRIALLGPEHSDVQLARAALGTVYLRLGRWAQAESLYTQALEGRRALFGPTHGAVAASIMNLGTLAAARGDLVTAGGRLREAEAMFEATKNPSFRDVARLQLAAVRYRAGQLLAADSTVTFARAALRASGLRHVGLVRDLMATARAASTVGHAALADSLAADALGMQRAMAPPGSAALAMPLVTLATVRARAGQTTTLQPVVDEAQRIVGTGPAPVSVLLGLGESMCALRPDAASVAMLRRGLDAAGPTPAVSDSASVRVGREVLARCGR